MSEESVAYQVVPGLGAGMSEEYAEFLRPFLMQQRRALLTQVDSIEQLLGIEPTTADLRKGAKRGIVFGKEGG